MMIFNHEAYVWVWLPNNTAPVVAGKLELVADKCYFVYARSYLAREQAIALSPFELPLQRGTFQPVGLRVMPSCLRDAGPDAWGRRLLQYQYAGAHLNELDYLLLSGGDRIGALDFQMTADRYQVHDGGQVELDVIEDLAAIVEQDIPYVKQLAPILMHGTSIGGARPKCLLDIAGVSYIAKFALSSDYYPIIKAEFIAMSLARKVGIDVADVQLSAHQGRDILLVKRFDRGVGGERRCMLSGLSLLGLDEMEARYASYKQLANIIRQKFAQPREMLLELFKRLVFNILMGNTDDHARNHSAFWDGQQLLLTPAYDICPQQRVGHEATQAMAIEGKQANFATLMNALSICDVFLLNEQQARELIEQQLSVIQQHWAGLCQESGLSQQQQALLWHRSVLSDFALQGFVF